MQVNYAKQPAGIVIDRYPQAQIIRNKSAENYWAVFFNAKHRWTYAVAVPPGENRTLGLSVVLLNFTRVPLGLDGGYNTILSCPAGQAAYRFIQEMEHAV